MSSLTKSLINRQIFDHNCKDRQILSSVIESHPFVCSLQKTFNSSINYLDIDSIDFKFLLIGYNDGSVDINEITDQNTGHFNHLFNKKLETTVNRCQWYSIDSGMFAITSSGSVTLMDTNTMTPIERYKFPDCKLYWSDWSPNLTNCIAVGCSSSAIRIIDIRSGSSLQNITTTSMTRSVNHSITRTVWSPLDTECLIAGDSSGYLHIYDIRRPNRSVGVIGSDYTSCEPITCLQFTKDKMSVLTAHGLSNKLNLWIFKRSDLINSDINFECPYVRSKQSKRNLCQVFATDDYVFTPSEQKHCGNDIISYDIENGMKRHTLSTAKEGSFNTSGPNCVTGIQCTQTVIFSGGHKRLCVWTPNIDSEEDKKRLNKYFIDCWSDSE